MTVGPNTSAGVVVTTRNRPYDLDPTPEHKSKQRKILGPLMRTPRGRTQILASMYWPIHNVLDYQKRFVEHLLDAIEAHKGPLKALEGRWNHDRTLAGSILLAQTVLDHCSGAEEYDLDAWNALLDEARAVVGGAKPYTDQIRLAEFLSGVNPDYGKPLKP